MNSALATLIGATVGALASLSGTIIAQLFQGQRERRLKRVRDVDEAFSGTLRSVSRVSNLSASYSIESKNQMDDANREQIYRWVDAMIEASYWAGMLASFIDDHDGYLGHLRSKIEQQIDAALRGEAPDLLVFREARASLNQAMSYQPYKLPPPQLEN